MGREGEGETEKTDQVGNVHFGSGGGDVIDA